MCLGIDPYWITNFRWEALTSFFKIFPFFASTYFFLSAIGIGYWLRPHIPLFIHLGFLIPFSVILNYLFKELFSIPRPPLDLHLIPLSPSWGFPSGDVQVATVFWLSLYRASISKILRIGCASMILLIMASRVYLGVHSLCDVFVGFIFGLLTTALWNHPYFKTITAKWYKGSYINLLLVISLSLLSYIGLAHTLILPLGLIAAVGTLLGYVISLPYMQRGPLFPDSLTAKDSFKLFLSLFFLLLMANIIPIIKSQGTIILYSSILVKYAFLTMLGYVFLPIFQRRLFQKGKNPRPTAR
jgi:membrane-associated phospholipid phosphatase